MPVHLPLHKRPFVSLACREFHHPSPVHLAVLVLSLETLAIGGEAHLVDDEQSSRVARVCVVCVWRGGGVNEWTKPFPDHADKE
jgi:hypothetical protein